MCGCCLFLGGFVVGFFLPGKFDFNLMLIPVVDRPCLALVRQCRKKKSMPGVKDDTVQLPIKSVVLLEYNFHIGGDWCPKGKAELRRSQCTHFCRCLVPRMLNHTSSSWLTAHLRSVYLAIPPHCLLGAPATNSTQI